MIIPFSCLETASKACCWGCQVETGNSHKVSLQNLDSGDARAGVLEDIISKRKEEHRENSRDLQGLNKQCEQNNQGQRKVKKRSLVWSSVHSAWPDSSWIVVGS